MKRKLFEVYNHFGDQIVAGDATQCAKALGLAETSFRQAAELGERYSRYRIVSLPQPEKVDVSETKRLSAQWDAFCEPIRKKYNIPVYKAKLEVRG